MSQRQDMTYRVIGRCSLVFDLLRGLFEKTRHWRPGGLLGSEPDETGRVSDNNSRPEILWDDGDVIFVSHGKLIHSFARAQEFSLLREHKTVLQQPILDFGCGDGSFASVLFSEIDYGLDVDGLALERAKSFGTYKTLLRCTDDRIPLSDGAVRSVFSNSVLEHLNHLQPMLTEIYRILCVGGAFMFTVPLKQYERDLTKYFGRSAACRVNQESYHRNLLEAEEWKQHLERVGFTIELVRHYQPDWFTFWLRMLRVFGRRGLTMIIPGIDRSFLRRYHTRLVELVRASIHDTAIGGNMLVIASKDES